MQDESDFADYVTSRQRRLLQTAWLLTGDWQRAEDLVQTTMIKVWPRWSRILAGGDPDAYVRRVLFNTYASSWRRKWRHEWPTDNVPESGSDDGSLTSVELRDALARVLPVLTPRQRAVIVLRYFQDLSEPQTAATLGCSVGTVKSQTSKSLAKLRAALENSVKVEG